MTDLTPQICSRCVMDSSVGDISFNDQGVCNYCEQFLARSGAMLSADDDQRLRAQQELISQVRASSKGKRYGCIVGVSGGVDSSWVLVNAVKLGLRPLAVHMDNGWNSELAQNNIANLVRQLGVDLYTHVIDWSEYRSLMQAFFAADVVDVELLYDNAMLAVNYQQAARHGLHYILGGTNQATEGMPMPKDWNWFKYDKRNIEAIAGRYGGVRLKTFPAIGVRGLIWHQFIRRIRWVSFLDYFAYNKFDALEVLQRNYGYKPYPYKHYESIFTRFYQGYLLPEKFGIDKRKVHLGTLVAAGQLSREDALKGLEGVAYPSAKALEEDRQYFLKKMGWSSDQLDDYLSRPARSHFEFPSEKPLWDRLLQIYRRMKGS